MRKKFLKSFLLAGLLGTTAVGGAQANTSTDAASHARQVMPKIDARLKAAPDDPRALFAKAQASMALGRKADALQAYRKLAKVMPEAPRVQIEIARLEAERGNVQGAKSSLAKARAMPGTAAPERAHLDQVIEGIERSQSPHKFSGSASFGLTAQSNANAGPADRHVEFWGLPFSMSDQDLPQSDISAQASAALAYRYALNDEGDSLNAVGSYSLSRPSKLNELRRDTLQLSFGPEFDLARLGLQGKLSIAAMGSTSRLGGEGHINSRGISVSANLQVDPQHGLSFSYGHRIDDHQVSRLRTKADLKDATRNDYSASWTYLPQPDLRIVASANFENRNAKTGWNSYDGLGVSLAVAKRYASPMDQLAGHWTSQLRLSSSERDFKAADVMMGTAAEKSRVVSLDFLQSVPLGKNLVGNAMLSAAKSSSNYDVSNWSDKSIGLSITYSF